MPEGRIPASSIAMYPHLNDVRGDASPGAPLTHKNSVRYRHTSFVTSSEDVEEYFKRHSLTSWVTYKCV